MTAQCYSGRGWHGGQARQIPSTFRTRDRRFRGRIFHRAHNVTTEVLCDHEHATAAEAELCADAMAAAANEAVSV